MEEQEIKKFTDKEIIKILTALDIYFGMCGVMKRDELEELKEKVMSISEFKK